MTDAQANRYKQFTLALPIMARAKRLIEVAEMLESFVFIVTRNVEVAEVLDVLDEQHERLFSWHAWARV